MPASKAQRQDVLKHPLSARALWWLKGYPASRVLDLLQQSQWWSRSQLEDFRSEKLRHLIRHCYEHVPYYRGAMELAGLKPADFARLSDLPKMPVLTKELVRINHHRLIAGNVPIARTFETRTGGTTGEPLQIRRQPSEAAWQVQCYVRGLAWGGLRPGMARIRLFGGSLPGAPKDSWFQRLAKHFKPDDLFLPAFELGRHNVAQYVARIRNSGLAHMVGYSSALYLLAVLAEEKGLSTPLQTCYSTAELLPDAWADKIARVFSCKVLSYYGCGEVNSLGYQCGQGEGYHRCDEHAVIEVEDGGSAAFEGEGAFLLTDLDSLTMPFVRYRNGDAGGLSDAPCPCGRGLGRITKLHGRVFDYLLNVDGMATPGGYVSFIFRGVDGVLFWQGVQHEPGELAVRLVTDSGYDAGREEPRIREYFAKHLGRADRISFEYVHEIERTTAGKIRPVINRYLEQHPELNVMAPPAVAP